MNIKLEIAFFVFTLIAIFANFFWIQKTEKRLKRFFMGKKAKDLEETLIHLEAELVVLQKAKEQTEKDLIVVNQKLKKSIRGLETIRFNPFPDQGGTQSFAIGLQNEEGDGVVISSLYSRERMSVFAKPIKKGVSEYELTEEEKEVVLRAKV